MASKRISQRNVCTMADCGKIVHGHGYCTKHYFRWRKYGDPSLTRIEAGGFLHGHCTRSKKSPEYQSWTTMLMRCRNSNFQHFDRYGGRGITVCQRWQDSFTAFLADVGPRPTPKHTLDRYPNKDGNYQPGNVRWATRREQARNRGDNRLITAKGETLCLTEWAERLGMTAPRLTRRIDKFGWVPSEAVVTPPTESR